MEKIQIQKNTVRVLGKVDGEMPDSKKPERWHPFYRRASLQPKRLTIPPGVGLTLRKVRTGVRADHVSCPLTRTPPSTLGWPGCLWPWEESHTGPSCPGVGDRGRSPVGTSSGDGMRSPTARSRSGSDPHCWGRANDRDAFDGIRSKRQRYLKHGTHTPKQLM